MDAGVFLEQHGMDKIKLKVWGIRVWVGEAVML